MFPVKLTGKRFKPVCRYFCTHTPPSHKEKGLESAVSIFEQHWWMFAWCRAYFAGFCKCLDDMAHLIDLSKIKTANSAQPRNSRKTHFLGRGGGLGMRLVRQCLVWSALMRHKIRRWLVGHMIYFFCRYTVAPYSMECTTAPYPSAQEGNSSSFQLISGGVHHSSNHQYRYDWSYTPQVCFYPIILCCCIHP